MHQTVGMRRCNGLLGPTFQSFGEISSFTTASETVCLPLRVGKTKSVRWRHRKRNTSSHVVARVTEERVREEREDPSSGHRRPTASPKRQNLAGGSPARTRSTVQSMEASGVREMQELLTHLEHPVVSVHSQKAGAVVPEVLPSEKELGRIEPVKGKAATAAHTFGSFFQGSKRAGGSVFDAAWGMMAAAAQAMFKGGRAGAKKQEAAYPPVHQGGALGAAAVEEVEVEVLPKHFTPQQAQHGKGLAVHSSTPLVPTASAVGMAMPWAGQPLHKWAFNRALAVVGTVLGLFLVTRRSTLAVRWGALLGADVSAYTRALPHPPSSSHHEEMQGAIPRATAMEALERLAVIEEGIMGVQQRLSSIEQRLRP